MDLRKCTTQGSTHGSGDVYYWVSTSSVDRLDEVSLLGLTKPIFLLSCH